MKKLLKYFNTDYLPDYLRQIADPFKHLAIHLSDTLVEDEEEAITSIQKLLEAKDSAIRSAISQTEIN